MIQSHYYFLKVQEYFQKKRLQAVVNKEPGCNEIMNLHFIISPGRSGTTILRKNLMESTSIHIPPESSSFIILFSKEYLRKKSWKEQIDKSVEIFNSLNLNEFWNLDLIMLKRELNIIPIEKRSLRSLLTTYYIFHSKQFKPNSDVLIDKTPYLSQYLEWLKILYPGSRYLFLIRNPYQVTESRMFHFKENLRIASDKWIWAVEKYQKFKSRLNWKLVFYEDFVSCKDDAINEIVNFFSASSITKKNIALGDDHLKHHKNLQEDKVLKRIPNFNDEEKHYLERKFSRITNIEIKDYYNLN